MAAQSSKAAMMRSRKVGTVYLVYSKLHQEPLFCYNSENTAKEVIANRGRLYEGSNPLYYVPMDVYD